MDMKKSRINTFNYAAVERVIALMQLLNETLTNQTTATQVPG